jgi:hypothetical protein
MNEHARWKCELRYREIVADKRSAIWFQRCKSCHLLKQCVFGVVESCCIGEQSTALRE